VIVRLKPFALVLLLLLFTPVFSFPSFTQNASQSAPQNPIPIPRLGTNPDDHEDEEHAKIEKDMAKKLNHERQVQLQRDTDNLLKLATELKKYVDKSNENTLSLDVVKKAEEIEKLAHSVKEKMKAN
jgi:hypothetical protein